MNEAHREEFFDIVEEMVEISKELNRVVEKDGDKKWKMRLQFAMIRDLLRQAEALLKGDTDSNDF